MQSITSRDVVQKKKYLGINVTCDGRDDTEIATTRIAMARQVFLKHEKLLRNGLSLKLKKLILKTYMYIWSVLRYGSEIWVMKKTTVNKIDALEMWCYRRILKKPMDRLHHWWESSKSNEVREACANSLATAQKLMFIGHVIRGSAGKELKGLLKTKRERKRTKKNNMVHGGYETDERQLHRTVEEPSDRPLYIPHTH